MIQLLVVVCIGVLLSLLYGWILEFFAIEFLKLSHEHDLHFSITILIGVALLSGLLGIWSFYQGINTRTVFFFLLVALLIAVQIGKYIFIRLKIIYRQLKSLNILSWLTFILILIFALYRAAAASPVYDAGLYYLQTIHWMESYRVIPGLANLHVRLGFNSNIFLIAALLGFSDFGWHVYQAPGLIIFLSLTLYCLTLFYKPGRSLRISDILAIGITVFLLFAPSISWMEFPLTSDLPAAMISWCIFLLLIEIIDAGDQKQLDLRGIALIILAFFMVFSRSIDKK